MPPESPGITSIYLSKETQTRLQFVTNNSLFFPSSVVSLNKVHMQKSRLYNQAFTDGGKARVYASWLFKNKKERKLGARLDGKKLEDRSAMWTDTSAFLSYSRSPSPRRLTYRFRRPFSVK